MHKGCRISENTSTPKRRRLGTKRSLVSPLNVFHKQFSPVKRSLSTTLQSTQRCDSPPIPCNQKEYLSDSATNSSSSFVRNVLQSPGFVGSSFELDDSNNANEDCNATIEKHCDGEKAHISTALVQNVIDNISDDMFHSKLEIQKSFTYNHETDTLLTSKCEKYFRQEIVQSFEEVNKSICGLESNRTISDLFETKDSFLLDIKDTGTILEESKKHNNSKTLPQQSIYDNINTFYGLPLITKDLFKTYRNIEKFHDWQEECLNLDAIKNRKNLIYALPTSGGKTLVAEVLMLNEVLNRKQNALFILPFVAIVQEKIWSLSPFAVQLDFLVEEYAAGKGHIPPKKRRKKNSIYIATIEKGLALVRSLIELNRLNEIGLIVVDELHLIGEAGRGSTLETLLSTVIFANQGIQIVGMSATIGNLPEIAEFLSATVYEREFRPVQLVEYVKLGDMLHRLVWGAGGLEVVPEREISFDYSPAATALDPDWLGGLVSEVSPAGSCLVFCPTKRNCENVAALLCKMQRREMTVHRTQERSDLSEYLRTEGASAELVRSVRHGVAYHHAGLASDERSALENAFRSGVISVLCCTSTLAAGVNLPARRVIIRAPLMGREQLSLGAYRQMAGRAGRTGHAENGESIIICSERSWPSFLVTLRNGLSAAQSTLPANNAGMTSFVLSAVSLGLASTRESLRGMLDCTLCRVQADRLKIDMKQVCDTAICSLLQSGAIMVQDNKTDKHTDRQVDTSHVSSDDCYVFNDSVLTVSKLGIAAIKGCLDLASTRLLLQDLETASRALVLMGSVHLLYLCTPQNAAGIRPDYRHYYRLYCGLNEECLQTANVLGITEKSAIRMITGKPITNVPETVLARFYLALILYDLWNQLDFNKVVEKYAVSRGTIQQLMTSAASMAASVARVCEQLEERWAFLALFNELAPRLQHCAAPELRQLCELPNVKKARALQLSRLGYKRIEQVARASVDDLVAGVDHLSRTAAQHLISAARMMLIEKVENLRAEAEDVMEELNM